MEISQETLDLAEALLRNAYQNAGAPIQDPEVATLALKIAFAASVQGRNGFEFFKNTKGVVGSPSLALAASMASRVRSALEAPDDEPLFDLPRLLSEKLGTDILLLDNDRVSGGCILMNIGAFVVLPVNRRPSDLFVCAHELGHLLLLSLRTDPQGAVVDAVHDGSRSARSPNEHFADAFARELLIPGPGLGFAIQEIREQFKLSGPIGDIELLYLSRVFGVSFLVMAKRCERIGLLPEGAALTLYKILVEQFGGPEERADKLQLPPRPVIEIASVPRSIQAATIQEIVSRRTVKQQPSLPERPANRKLA